MADTNIDTTSDNKVETKDGKPSRVGKFVKYAFLIVLAGWVSKLTTLPEALANLIVGIALTLLLGDIVLEAISGDSHIKRFLKSMWTAIFAILVYLVFRWLVGQLIGISLLDTIHGLKKVSALGWLGGGVNTPVALTFETCFFVFGLIVAWLTVYSKYGSWIGVAVLVLVSFLGIWMVQAPEHFKATTRYTKAYTSAKTRATEVAAMKKEAQGILTYGTLTADVFDGDGKIILHEGQSVALAGTSVTAKGAEPMIQVYPEVNGIFDGSGQIFTIPLRKFKQNVPEFEVIKKETSTLTSTSTANPLKRVEKIPDAISVGPGVYEFEVAANSDSLKFDCYPYRWFLENSKETPGEFIPIPDDKKFVNCSTPLPQNEHREFGGSFIIGVRTLDKPMKFTLTVTRNVNTKTNVNDLFRS